MKPSDNPGNLTTAARLLNEIVKDEHNFRLGAFTVISGEKERRDELIYLLTNVIDRTIIQSPSFEYLKTIRNMGISPRVIVYNDMPEFLKAQSELQKRVVAAQIKRRDGKEITEDMAIMYLKEILGDMRQLNISLMLCIDDYTKLDWRIYQRADYKIYLEGSKIPQTSLVSPNASKFLKGTTGIIERDGWGLFKYGLL